MFTEFILISENANTTILFSLPPPHLSTSLSIYKLSFILEEYAFLSWKIPLWAEEFGFRVVFVVQLLSRV